MTLIRIRHLHNGKLTAPGQYKEGLFDVIHGTYVVLEVVFVSLSRISNFGMETTLGSLKRQDVQNAI